MLIPQELLQKSDKILFITHLAIGDYTYMQNYFRSLAQAYPNLKIHIWVDDVRRTRCFWRWKHLQKYVLYDWLRACPFVDKIYDQTYRPRLLQRSLRAARNEQYPIVVSLATLRPHQYARLARYIAPKGFVAGMQLPTRFYHIVATLGYRRLDVALPLTATSKQGRHISAIYANWFEQLFGVQTTEVERYPFVRIPNKWVSYAKLRFMKWEITKKSNQFAKVIFLNPYAKTDKRSWPLERIAELIKAIKQQDQWGDVSFIVNVVPEEMVHAKKFFDQHSFNRTYLFSAEHSFFQLPAMMSLCDVIISVETAVMHLANAVHVPVVALMRQKNPEWVPIDQQMSYLIMTPRRKDWVNAITVDAVLAKLNEVVKG
jgi:ADP-heptose:LPS heptosyltransferase